MLHWFLILFLLCVYWEKKNSSQGPTAWLQEWKQWQQNMYLPQVAGMNMWKDQGPLSRATPSLLWFSFLLGISSLLFADFNGFFSSVLMYPKAQCVFQAEFNTDTTTLLIYFVVIPSQTQLFWQFLMTFISFRKFLNFLKDFTLLGLSLLLFFCGYFPFWWKHSKYVFLRVKKCL